MAGYTYKERVEDYLGYTISDTDAINAFLIEASRKLVDLIPYEKAKRWATTTTVTASTGISVTTCRLLQAYKGNYATVMVPDRLLADVQDSGSIHYATDRNPAAVVAKGMLYVFPDGGTLEYIPYPTPIYSDSTTNNFPTEFEEAMIIDVASKFCHNKLNSAILAATTSFELYHDTYKDIELAQGKLNEVQTLMGNYLALRRAYFEAVKMLTGVSMDEEKKQ